jgi:hypothetical protein
MYVFSLVHESADNGQWILGTTTAGFLLSKCTLLRDVLEKKTKQ